MGSAIILARRDWKVSSFEHYFRPVFDAFEIAIDALHGFNSDHEDQILLALRGNKLETKIYEAIKDSISAIEKDNEANKIKWLQDTHNIPEWRMAYSGLIDRTPEFIGTYGKDGVALELFSSVALGYIARASGKSITELVENSTRELRALGESLSGL